MQSFIFKNKNLITFLSAILITTAFISKWTVDNLYLFTWSLVIATVIGALPIALQAYQAIRIKVVSIDVLVTIAVIGAFLIQNYEESAIVTFLFLFGAYLEQRTLKHTRSAIKELTDMAPESALKMIENGEFIEIDVDDVNEGDLLLVKTGAKVPVDGRVISGEGYINEASITGESLPVNKEKDSMVYAGTILENGTLQIIADRVGEDTTFGRIIDLVEEAQDSKSQVEKFIDRFSKYYTPVVLILAFVVWIITNNIELAITILVLGCPGALVIGVPVSNVAGIGNGARHGVLLKGSEVITEFSKVNSMVFDKTGTLTVGDPSVSETIYYTEDSAMVLSYLASIERESDHPLAKAILNELGEIELHNVENTEVVKGGGIVANINGQRIAVGNISLMEKEDVTLSDNVMADIDRLIKKGNSLVLTSVDGKLKLLIGIRDQIRSGVKKELSRLKKMGVKNLIMLSGDILSMNPATTGVHKPPYASETPIGIFAIQDQKEKMFYTKDGSNEIAGYAPYASRFTNGAYIHGVPTQLPQTRIIEWSNTLGTTPRSHMCVRVASSQAKFVFDLITVKEAVVVVID
jgi:Cd2+/Zn2+-exporting ATPase